MNQKNVGLLLALIIVVAIGFTYLSKNLSLSTNPLSSQVAQTPTVNGPTVTLTSVPAAQPNGLITINEGETVTLTWLSDKANSCRTIGKWDGVNNSNTVGISGSKTIGASPDPILTSIGVIRTYTIWCLPSDTNITNQAMAKTMVYVYPRVANQAPTVSLNANPTTVVSGSPSTITWSSTNATSCNRTGSWTGTEISGNATVNPTANSVYNISCTGTGGSVSTSTEIVVTAPTNRAPIVSQLGLTNPNSPAIVNTQVSFTATASDTDGKIKSLKWIFGDGTAAQTVVEQTPLGQTVSRTNTHTYVNPGTYNVAVFAYDDNIPTNAVSAAKLFRVTVNPSITACTYTLNPVSGSISIRGGTGSISITTQSGCAWNATSTRSTPWLHIINNGIGNGILNYSVDASNVMSARKGLINIGGNNFTVMQDGSTGGDGESPTCTFIYPKPAPSPISTFGNATTTLSVFLTDNFALASTTIYISDVHIQGGWRELGSTTINSIEDNFSIKFNPTTVTNGPHTLMCSVVDASNNQAYSTTLVNIDNIVSDPGLSQYMIEVSRANTIGESIGTAVKIDNQGNAIVAGNYNGTVRFATTTGGITSNEIYCRGTKSANDHSCTSSGGSDIFIAKYGPVALATSSSPNPVPSLIWVKTFGGSLNESVNSVAVDSLNNISISGSFTGITDFGGETLTSSVESVSPTGGITYAQDIFVSKYSSAGNNIWSRRMGGRVGNNSAFGIDTNVNGDVFVAGQIYSIAGLNNEDCSLTPVPATCIYTRNGSSDGFLVKLASSTGSTVWSINFGGIDTDIVRGLTVDRDGNPIIVGYTSAGLDIVRNGGSNITFGSIDLFILKYNGITGDNIFAKVMGSTGADSAEAVAVDADRNIFVTGAYSNSINFDGQVLRRPPFNNGFYIVKYTPAGISLWARGIELQSSSGGVISRGIGADSNGNVVVTGVVSEVVDFGSGVTSAGNGNIFIAKYGPDFIPSPSGIGNPVKDNFIWAKRSANVGYSSGYGVSIDPRVGEINRNIFMTGYIQGDFYIDSLRVSSLGRNLKSPLLYKVSP